MFLNQKLKKKTLSENKKIIINMEKMKKRKFIKNNFKIFHKNQNIFLHKI